MCAHVICPTNNNIDCTTEEPLNTAKTINNKQEERKVITKRKKKSTEACITRKRNMHGMLFSRRLVGGCGVDIIEDDKRKWMGGGMVGMMV